jgi:type VI secretion system secreted protein VgrG
LKTRPGRIRIEIAIVSDFITFASSLLPSTARVVSFRGTEGISRLYRFDVFVTAPAEDIDFDLSEVIGTKARLVLGAAVEPLP